MVKNSGGCRTKGLARKLVNAPVSDKVRQIEEDGECYAIVSKMLGNGMCHVNVLQNDNIIPKDFFMTVLRNCQRRQKLYYDLVPINVIKLNNGQYSLIDLESVYSIDDKLEYNLYFQHIINECIK